MNNLYLAHHGILGQKWGVRRYQNEDGSLTPAGEKRYYNESTGNTIVVSKPKKPTSAEIKEARKNLKASEEQYKKDQENFQKELTKHLELSKEKFEEYYKKTRHKKNEEDWETVQRVFDKINSDPTFKKNARKYAAANEAYEKSRELYFHNAQTAKLATTGEKAITLMTALTASIIVGAIMNRLED
ncbi:MAG: hypothetical protein J6U54_25160 [Clostridiales bacterium]|nr:hypothetical protein [Clostridiales bacterium]